MEDKEKVEALAKELFVGALASATELGSLDHDDLRELLAEVKEICFIATEVFYDYEVL